MARDAGVCALVGLVAALASVGCGDDVVVGDVGVDGATPDGGGGVAAPEIPWLADEVPPLAFTPCPDGWREETDRGVTTCEPFSESGQQSCGDGEAHFVGEPGCLPVGAPCPTGDFPEDLPPGAPVVYVQSGAPAGGDGTAASPFGSLSEVGWVSLAAGTVVALAKGSYEGTLPLKPGLHVIGACAAETVLTGASIPVRAVVSVTRVGELATVASLSIADPPQLGVSLSAGQSLALEGVEIRGAESIAVELSGAGTTLTAREVVLRDTRPGATEAGRGLTAVDGARAEVTRAVIAGNRQVSIIAGAESTEVVLRDVVVRDTLADAAGVAGRAVNVQQSARVVADRVLIDGSREIGARVGTGGELVLTDVVVRNTDAQEVDGEGGFGIAIEDGSRLEGRRVVVAESRTAGISGIADAEIVLSDVVVRDTLPRQRDGGYGRGITITEGSRMEGESIVISDNLEVGLGAFRGSEMNLSDVMVRGTDSQESDGLLGRGVSVEDESTFSVTRMLVVDNHELGIASDGGILSLTDVVIRRMLPRRADMTFGYGIGAQYGTMITGSRIVVEDTLEIGINSIAGGAIDLSDVTVSNVAGSASSIAERMDGHAVTAFGATTTLRRFRLSTAATCGLFLAELLGTAPSLDVESGLVEGAAIGACVQYDGYDLDRLMRDVTYRDNGVNLDATMLPVPEPPGTVEP